MIPYQMRRKKKEQIDAITTTAPFFAEKSAVFHPFYLGYQSKKKGKKRRKPRVGGGGGKEGPIRDSCFFSSVSQIGQGKKKRN